MTKLEQLESRIEALEQEQETIGEQIYRMYKKGLTTVEIARKGFLYVGVVRKIRDKLIEQGRL